MRVDFALAMTVPFASCTHAVHFYRDDDVLRVHTASFLATALRAGRDALVLARPALLEALRIELHRQHVQGPPFGPDRGEFVAMDAHSVLERICIAGRPDETRFRALVAPILARLTRRDEPPAAYGELVAVLCERGQYADAVQLEKMWNALLADQPARLYCAYPSRLFTSVKARGFYRQICRTHEQVRDDALAAEPA